MVFAYIYGYAGPLTSVPLSDMTPYVTWSITDETHAAAVRAAGVKVAVYSNFWRNYSSDNPNVGYLDLRPGGLHAAAETQTCGGSTIYDPNYGGGYEADPRSSDALPHAQLVADYRLAEYGSNYDALFSDDTGTFNDLPLPCGFDVSTFAPAANAIHASLQVPLFVNTLGAGLSPITQVAYENAPNIIGAECEECYASNSGVPVTGANWQDTENAEIQTIASKRIFWMYPRPTSDAASETALRAFLFASFLLTYDPSYAMFEETFSTQHNFPVMPETGLVPENPVTTASSVTSYRQAGGIYMREFAKCYYRGSAVGKCAVAVNADNTTEALSASGYAHSLSLSGSGVLDGGSVSFSGPAVTSLAPGSGSVLFP